MPKVSKRTFSLPAEQAAFERWLREEVVPTYEATKGDPSTRIPAKAVYAEARARLQQVARGAPLKRRTVTFRQT